MGIDLNLIILRDKGWPTWRSDKIFDLNHLRLDRDDHLFDLLRKLPLKKLEHETISIDDKFGEPVDSYGSPLKYANVKDLKLLEFFAFSDWNIQVFNFVKSLDDKDRIILFWC